VTSSDFPHYTRNLNTGEDNNATAQIAVANQSIYLNAERPSHIVLPIIPR